MGLAEKAAAAKRQAEVLADANRRAETLANRAASIEKATDWCLRVLSAYPDEVTSQALAGGSQHAEVVVDGIRLHWHAGSEDRIIATLAMPDAMTDQHQASRLPPAWRQIVDLAGLGAILERFEEIYGAPYTEWGNE